MSQSVLGEGGKNGQMGALLPRLEPKWDAWANPTGSCWKRQLCAAMLLAVFSCCLTCASSQLANQIISWYQSPNLLKTCLVNLLSCKWAGTKVGTRSCFSVGSVWALRSFAESLAECQMCTLWPYSSPVPYLVWLVKLSKQFGNLWLNEFRYISKFVYIKRDCITVLGLVAGEGKCLLMLSLV